MTSSCRHRALTRGQVRLTRHLSPKVPKAPPPPAPVDVTAADTAAAEEKRKLSRRRGRSATILTSPMGADLGNVGGAPGAKTLGAQ